MPDRVAGWPRRAAVQPRQLPGALQVRVSPVGSHTRGIWSLEWQNAEARGSSSYGTVLWHAIKWPHAPHPTALHPCKLSRLIQGLWQPAMSPGRRGWAGGQGARACLCPAAPSSPASSWGRAAQLGAHAQLLPSRRHTCRRRHATALPPLAPASTADLPFDVLRRLVQERSSHPLGRWACWATRRFCRQPQHDAC